MEWTFAHWFIAFYLGIAYFLAFIKLALSIMKRDNAVFIGSCVGLLIISVLHKSISNLVTF